MTEAPVLSFVKTDIPDDEPPPTIGDNADFDPEYPGSTADAPYGFKDNGEPYKRRPWKSATSSTGSRRMPASDSSARAAAALLAQLNQMIAMGITMAAGLPNTGNAILEGNKRFEETAFQALQTDPQLCKKILSVGATSGKAGLVMAYGMLGMSIVPAATAEIRERRSEVATDGE